MPDIKTQRLHLIALNQAQLERCLCDLPGLARELACTIAPDLVPDIVRRAIGIKLAKMAETDPADHSWYTYWLIVVDDGAPPCGAGFAGFKGSPGVVGRYDAMGEVEIGYGIAPEYQGRGYMTEAVRALIAWAFDDPACQAVIAPEVLRSNPASSRVLAKAGMHAYAETDDTISWRIERREGR